MNSTERITVAGFGGQGVMMIGQLLAYTGNEKGLNCLWFPSYGPETRGGTANCAVIISEQTINSPVFARADTLIIMNKPSLVKFQTKVMDNGIILYNSSLIDSEVESPAKVYPIPANDLAIQIGNPKVANMVMLGAYLAAKEIFTFEEMAHTLELFLGESKKHLLEIDLKALKAGYDLIKGGKDVTD
ncbi:MAG: 2-oxoacid:ferredoxin oxidoreductase subunit gamma [Acholeplasmataceae bacterium]|nr:2-oxoacid:ferredoxin oxidoreductase subunit gamma [Acholeplasmataceae bacterium]